MQQICNFSLEFKRDVFPVNRDMINNYMDPIILDSTDAQAVAALVISLMRTQPAEYTVLNEHQEDITPEIKKLVSLRTRMLKSR